MKILTSVSKFFLYEKVQTFINQQKPLRLFFFVILVYAVVGLIIPFLSIFSYMCVSVIKNLMLFVILVVMI